MSASRGHVWKQRVGAVSYDACELCDVVGPWWDGSPCKVAEARAGAIRECASLARKRADAIDLLYGFGRHDSARDLRGIADEIDALVAAPVKP